jgi:Xaa-Pro aminopeptidase
LKGHIDVCRLIFPIGTKGIQIDAFARQHLWKMGLNYGHGTGHGVGFFMNVHEPPQGIVSAWNQRGMTELVAGMLTSNEPGFYKEDSHGIRVENLVLTVPNGDNFLAFENVTLFPIDTNLIDKKSFGPEYRKWLNEYHKKCYKKISPFLIETEKTWLKEKCKSY